MGQQCHEAVDQDDPKGAAMIVASEAHAEGQGGEQHGADVEPVALHEHQHLYSSGAAQVMHQWTVRRAQENQLPKSTFD
jgi:glutamate 5-kinase